MNNITNRIANLPMYDWPETEDALNRLWYSIQRKLNSSDIRAPKQLEREIELSTAWKSQNLLIGQTCGWPFANTLSNLCSPFATIYYDIKDCPPGLYNCVYIGQSKKDIRFLENYDTLLEAEKIALNGADSQSGFHVFKEITQRPSEIAIPESKRLITGAHRRSIRAVAEGKAQLAAIDTVCFELARRHEPDVVANVSVLGRSIPKPGLPLITANRFRGIIPALLEAVAYGIYNLSDSDKDTLLIKGLMPARKSDYDEYL